MDEPFVAETKQLFTHMRRHTSDALTAWYDNDFGVISSNAEGGTPAVRDRAGWGAWVRGLFA